jgi:DHA1 family quinolone resistance protein-like MFS transporter
MLRLGSIIIAIVPVGYIISTSVYHLYFVEFFYGIGAAFAYPAWSSLFTSNLEKGKRGFQYSIYSSSVGVGTALTAVIGGWLAQTISFQFVFVLTGLMAMIGLFVLFRLERQVLRKT